MQKKSNYIKVQSQKRDGKIALRREGRRVAPLKGKAHMLLQSTLKDGQYLHASITNKIMR
jgi:hypothetical protein